MTGFLLTTRIEDGVGPSPVAIALAAIVYAIPNEAGTELILQGGDRLVVTNWRKASIRDDSSGLTPVGKTNPRDKRK